MSDPKYIQAGFDKLLSHMVEECGEFLAAAGKTQRWGTHSVNPEITDPQRQEPNVAWLLRELKDVQEAARRLRGTIENGDYPLLWRPETLEELEEDGRR